MKINHASKRSRGYRNFIRSIISEEAVRAEENVEENVEATTIEAGEQRIFFAPDKCRSNQRFIDGRCRTVY